MDRNETAQKLLNQDHEVKRRMDRKKENADSRAFKENSTGTKGENAIIFQRSERNGQSQHSLDQCQSIPESNAPYVDLQDQNTKNLSQDLISQNRSLQPHFQNKSTRFRTSFHRVQSRNFVNKGHARNTTPAIIQEYRIVRDNRVKPNSPKDGDTPLTQCSAKDQTFVNAIEIISMEKQCDERHTDMTVSEAQTSTQLPSGYYHSKPSQFGSSSSKVDSIPGPSEYILPTCSTSNFTSQSHSQSNCELYSEVSTSNNTIVGQHSSSSDPVHVPSSDSRLSSSIGDIKHEVEVVGVRWQTSKPSSIEPPMSNGSSHTQHLGMNLSLSLESSTVKSNQFHQSSMSESDIPNTSFSRSLLSGQSNNKSNQQVGIARRGVQCNMEWKPKVTQKIILDSPTADNTTRSSVGISDISKIEEVQLFEEFSEISIHGGQQIIIAQDLQLPEPDHSCVTFGSFGVGNDSSQGLAAQVAIKVNSKDETAPSFLSPSGESGSSRNHKDIQDDHSRNSWSFSPKCVAITENPLSKGESLNPEDSSNNSHFKLLQNYEVESQHKFETPSISNLLSYDPHTGYCIPFLSTKMEESMQGQRITSSQEERIKRTVEFYSHLRAEMYTENKGDAVRQSNATIFLGNGKVADTLLWKDKKRTLAVLFVVMTVYYCFFAPGYTFIAAISKLLLTTTILLFIHSLLPAKALGCKFGKIPGSCFNLSEETTKKIAKSTAAAWNSMFAVFESLCLGNNWMLFAKVVASLLILSFFGTLAWQTVFFTGLLLSFVGFYVYDKKEDEINELIHKAMTSASRLKLNITGKLPLNFKHNSSLT